MNALTRIWCLTVLLTAPCRGADEWLYGTWEFDKAATFAGVRTNPPPAPPPAAPGVPDWVSPHPLLVIAQLDGARYSFSATNLTASTKTQTNVTPYTVLHRRGSNEVVIQTGGVGTNTIRRVADRLEIDPGIGFTWHFTRITK